jgi:hypothetical protein
MISFSCHKAGKSFFKIKQKFEVVNMNQEKIQKVIDNDFKLEVGVGYTHKELEAIREARLNYSREHNYWNWVDIVFQLLEDPMIDSRGCDGLLDAYNALNGLLGITELMYDEISYEFICKVINASIKARNHYTFMNGAKEIPYVELKDDGFFWELD